MQTVTSPGIADVNECIRFTQWPFSSKAQNRIVRSGGTLKYALPSSETGTVPMRRSTANEPPEVISDIAPQKLIGFGSTS